MVAQSGAPQGDAATEVPAVTDVLGATRARSVATHIAAIKSPAVLGQAFDRLPRRFRDVFVPEGVRKSLEDLPVTVEAPAEADVIKISVVSGDRTAAAALANAIARGHIRYTREFNREVARSALSYLQTELAAGRDKVDEAERALLDEQRRTRIFNAQQQADMKASSAIQAEYHADDAGIEYRVAQAELAKLRAEIAREPAMPVSFRTEDTNPLAESLRQSVADLKVTRSGRLVDFAPSSPEVREIDAQIAAAQKGLSTENPRVTRTEQKSLNAVREALRQQAAQLEAKADSSAARERENRRLQERYVKELYDLSAARAKMLRLTTARDVLRENYLLLRSRSQNLTMRAQAGLADVSMLSPAEVPKAPVGPRKMVQGLFVVFVSALLSCAAAWFAELLSPRRPLPD